MNISLFILAILPFLTRGQDRIGTPFGSCLDQAEEKAENLIELMGHLLEVMETCHEQCKENFPAVDSAFSDCYSENEMEEKKQKMKDMRDKYLNGVKQVKELLQKSDCSDNPLVGDKVERTKRKLDKMLQVVAYKQMVGKDACHVSFIMEFLPEAPKKDFTQCVVEGLRMHHHPVSQAMMQAKIDFIMSKGSQPLSPILQDYDVMGAISCLADHCNIKTLLKIANSPIVKGLIKHDHAGESHSPDHSENHVHSESKEEKMIEMCDCMHDAATALGVPSPPKCAEVGGLKKAMREQCPGFVKKHYEYVLQLMQQGEIPPLAELAIGNIVEKVLVP